MTDVARDSRTADAAPAARSAKPKVACEVYSRIVGYLRPVSDWNKGKQQEFSERKTYDVPQPRQPDLPSN